MTVAELAKQYLSSVLVSDALRVHLRLAFQDLVKHFPDQEVADLTRRQLEEYQVVLHRQPLAANTIYYRWTRISRLLDWAVRQRWLLTNPCTDLKMRKPPAPLPGYIPSVEEVRRVLESPSPYTILGRRDRLMWELFYGTGLRRRELAGLDWTDYERDNACLAVYQSKNKTVRKVPLGAYLVEQLEAYLQDVRPALKPRLQERALLIDVQGGRRLSHGAIAMRLQHYTRRLKLSRFTLHSFRHAYATHLLEGGARLWEVSLLLGHSKLDTTMIYTHILPAELLRVYRNTHPRAFRRCRSGTSS
jgi:site-specific recombinase XerD